LIIRGQACRRGEDYGQEEIRQPKRVVTATCALDAGPGTLRRIPVKTAPSCPKELIPELLADLYRLKVKPPLKAGDKVIPNWRETGIAVLAARTIE
jgi:CxxC motif-containing protein